MAKVKEGFCALHVRSFEVFAENSGEKIYSNRSTTNGHLKGDYRIIVQK